MNNPPNGRPTREESNNLSVLLAHELSHLILSHTLESYASTTLLLPALCKPPPSSSRQQSKLTILPTAKMCLDVIRTLIFPITALAGPFVSDAIGKSLDQAQEFKTVGRMLDSCGSRRLELEADLVGLRSVHLSSSVLRSSSVNRGTPLSSHRFNFAFSVHD